MILLSFDWWCVRDETAKNVLDDLRNTKYARLIVRVYFRTLYENDILKTIIIFDLLYKIYSTEFAISKRSIAFHAIHLPL